MVVERIALPNTTEARRQLNDASTIEVAALNDALRAIDEDERSTGLASPKALFFSTGDSGAGVAVKEALATFVAAARSSSQQLFIVPPTLPGLQVGTRHYFLGIYLLGMCSRGLHLQ